MITVVIRETATMMAAIVICKNPFFCLHWLFVSSFYSTKVCEISFLKFLLGYFLYFKAYII